MRLAEFPIVYKLHLTQNTTGVEITIQSLNKFRTAAALAATAAYIAAKPTDPEDVLTDLLADLMHHAQHTGQDFDAALRKAKGHFLVETLPKAGGAVRPGKSP